MPHGLIQMRAGERRIDGALDRRGGQRIADDGRRLETVGPAELVDEARAQQAAGVGRKVAKRPDHRCFVDLLARLQRRASQHRPQRGRRITGLVSIEYRARGSGPLVILDGRHRLEHGALGMVDLEHAKGLERLGPEGEIDIEPRQSKNPVLVELVEFAGQAFAERRDLGEALGRPAPRWQVDGGG